MAGCFLTLRGMGIINFMLLANLNITKEPMEVGPTTHYTMGGVHVWTPKLKCPTCLDCSPRAKWPQDCTGRTGWAEIHCRTCSCSTPSTRFKPNTQKEKTHV